MRRIDKVYNFVVSKCRDITIDDVKSGFGVTAQDIEDELDILRNNASKELNQLVKDKLLVKIKKRPVLYITKEKTEALVNRVISDDEYEIDDFSDLSVNVEIQSSDPFNILIGANDSLKKQIEKAKAAILYPPNGLHTLIIGSTGVGKTLFANLMYDFAVHSGTLEENAPFIVFNCADYYNNPQFLISQLFGYVKGAFTGANEEKDGLVEMANNGILFLDEIHRLPAEGQEMIFNFMDTGTYRKLGESNKVRQSKVLIIGATTEDPESVLLKTFMRRIPILIAIPSLFERSTKDKVDLVKFLLSNEAHRVNKNIKIDRDSVKALIGSANYGNIGQLKSNIQLVCAKGFLNSLNKTDYIGIDYSSLSKEIKNGIYYYSQHRDEKEEITKYLDRYIEITPNSKKIILKEDHYEPDFNLYKIIEDKADILKSDGEDDEYIKDFISTDINIHLRAFFDKFKHMQNDQSKLVTVVNEDIIEFSNEVKELLKKEINLELGERFIFVFSLHFSAFMERINSKTELKYSNIEGAVDRNSVEFKAAVIVKREIEKRYRITVPDMEVPYLAVLINSIQKEDLEKNVAILVACHGTSTASSMVSVAKRIMGETNIYAVDMPLDVSPKVILEDMIDTVKKIDMGKGVLLLADMGSLTGFTDTIIDKTGINVKTIDMVSTAVCLEALRKSTLIDMDLDTLYESLKDFRGYGYIGETRENTDSEKITVVNDGKEKAIITICSTGVGTADKLKGLVESYINKVTDNRIRVFAISVAQINEKLEELASKYDILASIGIEPLSKEIPHISVESFISGNGEEIIRAILRKNIADIVEDDTLLVKELVMDNLNEFLTYINPQKVISLLTEFVAAIEEKTDRKLDKSTKIKLMLHTGMALERAVTGDTIKYSGSSENRNMNLMGIISDAGEIFHKSLNIILTFDEISYISDILA